MSQPRLLSPRRAVALVVSGALLASACGSSAPAPATPLSTAPEPAVSPPAQAHLPGTVIDQPGAPEGVAVTADGTVAVNVRDPDGLVIAPIGSIATAARRFVPLGGSARHLTLAGPDGPALVADESDDQFLEVALPAGQVVSSTHVGRQPHEAFAVAGGTVFVADELASTFHLVRDGHVIRVVPAPLQPGGGAASLDGKRAVGVGVRGRRITEYDTDGNIIGSANCGAGPTHTVTGSDGLFWVMDTNGGAVLGFVLTGTGPKQVATIPTGPGSRPYGVAYDPARHTLWVTLTAQDRLIGLTLQGTNVVHRVALPTVQQPNTVAVDPTNGEVVVTGSTAAGHLQVLTP